MLRPEVELSFHRHWKGKHPLPDDSADIVDKPCAMCAKDIAPPDLVRIRVQSAARRHAPSMPDRLLLSVLRR